VTLEEKNISGSPAIRENENANEVVRENSTAQSLSQSPPHDLPEKMQPKKSTFWKAMHWAVNFVAIGWVINAIVSVKLYDKIVKSAPELVKSFSEKSQTTFDAIGKAAGSQNWSQATLKKFSTLGKDFTDVIGTSLGGFLMVPLMGIYTSFQGKIEDAFSGKKYDKENHPPKHKESWSHWAFARIIGVASAVSLYMAIKYFAGKKFANINDSAVKWARNAKWIPEFLRPSEKEVEYYLAEQIAAVSSTAVLAFSKDKLDQHFPPDLVISESTAHRDRVAQSKPVNDSVKKQSESHMVKVLDKRAVDESNTGVAYAGV
jgi:hypothetical protein